ncbi:unnamed protein product [Meloidogyne enterolobii]|uniref:Uncharacterized protein n=1 Tax=Meloidogyne enterolobii TaxID=390850 RepID=A0ACB0ZI20_MELEN
MERRRVVTSSVEQFKCLGIESLVTGGAGKCLLDNECPEPCKCNGTVVDCSNLSLLSPPTSIPNFTTSLILSNNKITKLEPFAFGMGINKLTNLHTLNLSNNNLNFLAHNSLAGIENHRVLDLRNNSLNRLNVLEALSADNGINKIEDLEHERNSSLEILHLDGNEFNCISLEYMPSTLRKLTITRNPSLHSIILNKDTKNKLSLNIEIDSSGQLLCDCNLQSLLKEGGISWNNRQVPKCGGPENLRGMTLEQFKNVKCSDQGESTCSEEGILCPAGCKCTPLLNNYFEQQPKNLNNHRFRHRKRRLLFRHRREEDNFRRKNSVIVKCSNASLVNIPWPLPQNTEELLLDNNKIKIIKGENFVGLEHLKKL